MSTDTFHHPRGPHVALARAGRARRSALGVALAAVAMLIGCGARPRAQDTLAESVRWYHEGVRWERFASAAVRVPPAERSLFVEEMDARAADLKITDYDLVRVEARGPREARVQVKLAWYRSSEGTLRETHALQTWERRGDTWLLVAESRLRGAQMPGLAEPVEAPEAARLAPQSLAH